MTAVALLTQIRIVTDHTSSHTSAIDKVNHLTLITHHHHMLEWRCILVFVSIFSLSVYRYLSNGGIDQHEIFHDGTYWCWTDLLPLGGGGSTPWICKSEILAI